MKRDLVRRSCSRIDSWAPWLNFSTAICSDPQHRARCGCLFYPGIFLFIMLSGVTRAMYNGSDENIYAGVEVMLERYGDELFKMICPINHEAINL
jgi:hypothetical protein